MTYMLSLADTGILHHVCKLCATLPWVETECRTAAELTQHVAHVRPIIIDTRCKVQ